MLCLPGLTPVANVDQATGESAGICGSKPAVRSAFPKTREIRKFPFGQKFFGDRGIETIQAQKNQFANARFPQAAAPAKAANQHPGRPQKNRKNAGEEGDHQREQGFEKRESRAGSDIGEML